MGRIVPLRQTGKLVPVRQGQLGSPVSFEPGQTDRWILTPWAGGQVGAPLAVADGLTGTHLVDGKAGAPWLDRKGFPRAQMGGQMHLGLGQGVR